MLACQVDCLLLQQPESQWSVSQWGECSRCSLGCPPSPASKRPEMPPPPEAAASDIIISPLSMSGCWHNKCTSPYCCIVRGGIRGWRALGECPALDSTAPGASPASDPSSRLPASGGIGGRAWHPPWFSFPIQRGSFLGLSLPCLGSSQGLQSQFPSQCPATSHWQQGFF